MKTKYFIILGTFVLLVISSLYYLQGGFNDVIIKNVNPENRVLVGKYFEGNVNSKKFKNLFDTIRGLKTENNLKGDLGCVYFNNPENSQDEIKAFFGVFENRNITGFENYTIKKEQFLQGSIQGSSAFVNKTYNAIFEYADKNSIQLDEYYVEWFPSEKEVFIQIRINNEKAIN